MKKIIVENMSCVHCVRKIQKSLDEHNVKGNIDLIKKQVEVHDNDLKIAIEAIKAVGYKVKND